MGFKKQPWFNEKKFGIFIHYGLYSQIERGEWTMQYEHIPYEEYQKLADTFDPSHFDADRLARQAKDAGAGYLVLTTRHHEGFCLYDSQYSDYNSVKYVGRDLVREHVEACRRHGLRVGLYYSLLDWRFKGYHNRAKYPESCEAMVQQVHNQVRELLTNYGQIDYLFFDGGWFEDNLMPSVPDWANKIAAVWRSKELDDMIRELQPNILTNERSGYPGDVLTPEQKTRAASDGRYSEACMTIGDRFGWSFIHNNPNLKTSRDILQHMMVQAGFGGNFLLNTGPLPNGDTYNYDDRILSDIGRWLRVNGEGYYGTTKPDVLPTSMLGEFTQKGNFLYHHIFRWPRNGEAAIANVVRKVKKVTMLETGEELPFVQLPDTRVIVKGLPYLAPDMMATTLKFELSDEMLENIPDYGTL